MTTARRTGGTSLASRLVLVVLAPVAALGYFALDRIGDERAAATAAAAGVEQAELQQAVAQVYPFAQLERIGLEGLARTDSFGLPRDLVAVLSGVDMEQIYRDNQTQLDAALDQLAARFGDLRLPNGDLMATRMATVRGAIEVQRDLSVDLQAVPDEVVGPYAELDALLVDVLGETASSAAGRSLNERRRIQLDTLTRVLTSAGERAVVTLRAVVYQTESLRSEAAQLDAAHRAYLVAHHTTLGSERALAFAPVEQAAADLPPLPVVGSIETSAQTFDAQLIGESTDVVLANIEYLRLLSDYSQAFHGHVVEEATATANRASQSVRTTTIVLVAIGLLTGVLIAFVLWSILSPLRKLTRRATAISAGELGLPPLEVSGPQDVRDLIHTTNDMMTTLNQMQQAVGRLASGDLSPTAATELPGAIGVSMRESVERLTTVTAQLQRSEKFASTIVDEAADSIWTLDDHSIVRTANAAAARLLGRPAADQIGRPVTDLLATLSGETIVGGRTQVLVANSVVDVADERITIVIAHDISERARYEERLAYQASHDALTGLPNRFSLMQHLEQRLRDGERIAVLFVDLDGFKNVNDTKGHAVGDHVLRQVARTLEGCVGEHEFVGRLGGDEFVIVARQESDVASTVAFGQRVIDGIERPLHVDGQAFTLSASVGITLPPSDTSALDTIRQADNAVYQAKRRGRGRVEVYDASLQGQIEHEAELELALRDAVRNGELTLHLQPVFDLANDRIVAVEALVRWQRPGHGLVPPGEFIPIAERSSLIVDVERWVLREACRRAADWRRRDPSCRLRIAVNISGRHLVDGDLVDDVSRALVETGADPTMLELELTETQLLEDVHRATTVLDALRARGISIAVDDFGTGYSSLTYLRHLPIDTVKIDRSFVSRATEYGFDSTVVEALVTISRSLELSVVAEGVETDDQLAYLRTRGCDRAQGFLLARPVPADEIDALVFPAVALATR